MFLRIYSLFSIKSQHPQRPEWSEPLYQGVVSSQFRSYDQASRYWPENNYLRLLIFEAKYSTSLGKLAERSSVFPPDQSILSIPPNNSRVLLEVGHVGGHGGVARQAASRQVRMRGGGGSNVDRHEEGGREAGSREDGEE